jgi:hypothetical protein
MTRDREYEATSTMPVPVQGDAVPPGLASGEPAWPSKGSYQPTQTTPGLAPLPPGDFRPPPTQSAPGVGDLWRQPDRFSPSPGGPIYRTGPGVPQPTDQLRFPAPGGPVYRTGPGVPQPTDPPRPPGPAGPPRSPRPAGPGRSRRTLVLILTVLLAAGLAAAVAVYVLRPSHSSKSSAAASQTGTATQAAEPSPTSPPTSSGPASSPATVSEQQAATDLAGLLAQSVQDRSSIVAAEADVSDCGPTLSQDPQTFQNAAASRQQLLSQLADLPGRSALPVALLQDLTGAWQASEAADQDLGKWAQDEVSQGCTQNDQADRNYQAAGTPDNQATTDKKAFVSQWNPIATQYGLTTYQWNQL